MSITIHDLARIAGKDSSTVSRALRNDPRVKESTRKMIRQLADHYSYVPNLNARQLSNGKTGIIALLMGSLDAPLEKEAAMQLNAIFAEHNLTLMIISYAANLEKLLPDRIAKLQQKICDAAIILAPSVNVTNDSLLHELRQISCPLVCLDRTFPGLDVPVVTTDNTLAMNTLAQMSLDAGMDGAVINLPSRSTVSHDRRVKLEKFLDLYNIPRIVADDISNVPEFLKKHNIKYPAFFANSAKYAEDYVTVLPEKFITASFDREMPLGIKFNGPVFLCIQDYAKISEVAAQIILEQLKSDRSKRKNPGIIEIPAADFLTL